MAIEVREETPKQSSQCFYMHPLFWTSHQQADYIRDEDQGKQIIKR